MTSKTALLSALMMGLSGVGLVVGCSASMSSGAGDEPRGETEAEITSCGTRPNGPSMGGAGVVSHCFELDRVTPVGATLRGASVSLSLIGTSLYGAQNGAVIATADLVGTRMTAYSYGSSAPVPLRIDAVRWVGVVGVGTAHHEYAILGEVEPGRWEGVCGLQADGSPVMASLLPGVWGQDGAKSTATSELTAICPGSSLYKCSIDAGYMPWFSRTECRSGVCASRSLDAYHQACVRMLRADYCGDGVPHTARGTLVNGYDALGVQQDDSTLTTFEAEWGPSGARCVRAPRHVNDPSFPNHPKVLDYLRAHCPSRLPADPSSCGGATSTFPTATGFATPLDQRALLRSEAYPEWVAR